MNLRQLPINRPRDSRIAGVANTLNRALGRWHLLFSLASFTAAGCGARQVESHGGESHFLSTCEDDCPGGLACISGVCTRACERDAECSDLHSAAACSDHSERAATCDLACTRDASCGALGADFGCDDGVCRSQRGTSDVTTRDAATTVAPPTSSSAQPNPGSEPTSTEEVEGADAAVTVAPSVDGGNSTPSVCRYAHTEYPHGADVPAGACVTCTCQGGKVVCEEPQEAPCAGLPIVPCPEQIESDDVTVEFAYISDDTLTLELSHAGGCETHDYAVCYEQGWLESDPIQIELKLIHDAHGDSCEALLTASPTFSLLDLQERYTEIYDGASGVIATQFGTYAFGEPSCEERRVAAGHKLYNVTRQLDLTCNRDDDCETVTVQTDCFETCDTVVSLLPLQSSLGDLASKDLLAREVARIDAELCGGYTEECGAPGSGPVCGADACGDTCESGVARCIDDVCQLSAE